MNSAVANATCANIDLKMRKTTMNKTFIETSNDELEFWLNYFVKFTDDLIAKERALQMKGLTNDISLNAMEASTLTNIISNEIERKKSGSMFDHFQKCRGCVHLDAIGRCLSFISAKEDYSCWQGSWNGWIPVESEKPATTRHILVTVKWSEDDYEVFELDYGVTKYNAEHFDDEWSKNVINNIIAWRSMPEPYKEKL